MLDKGPKSAGRLASGRRRARSHRARFVVREAVDQHQVWHEPAFEKVANAISALFLRSGIYPVPDLVHLPVLCLERTASARSLRSGLASGGRGSHPGTQRHPAPRPLVVHPRRQAVAQSVLALGRACQCDASIRGLRRPRPVDGGLWRRDRRHPDCDLSRLRRLGDRGLRGGLPGLPALSRLRSCAEHVSRGLRRIHARCCSASSSIANA